MKLPSRRDLVKPDRVVLTIAGAAAFATVLATLIVLAATSRDQARMDRFGTAAARAMAELAALPLMREDRLHLGVLGNRLAETPEISGVASYSSDNQVLASTGELTGPQYTQPVTIDDSIVGYVRVAVHPGAFAEPAGPRALALLVIAPLIALGVASAWTFAGAVRRGDVAAAIRARRRAADAGDDAAAAEVRPPSADDPGALPDVRHYVLAVNLYNQLSLDGNEREFERSLCTELAMAVAEVYGGQVVTLPGVGVLVDFDHSDDDDRPFQVLCAAFVLCRLLTDEAPFGRYRLGLHLTTRSADEPLAPDDPAVADAALLSALAREGTLAVSAPCAEVLDGSERFDASPLVNPLLDELTTSSPGCRLVTGLAAPFASLVAQQAEQLKTQRDTVSSPSTF